MNNPHDLYFKAMMAEDDLARDFLRTFLPHDVSALIDFNTIAHHNSSFLDANLKEKLSDAVFFCNLSQHPDQKFYISIIIEHKSYPDKFVAVQMLSYLANAYSNQLNSGKKIYPVIPLLYYHGKRKWIYKPLNKLIEDVPEGLLRFVPDFDMVFIDLVRLHENEIAEIKNSFLISALMMHKFSSEPQELLDKLDKILTKFDYQNDRKRNFIRSSFVYVFSVTTLTKEKFIEISKIIPKSSKTEFMTTYEMIEQIGIEKGIEKGKNEGRHEGIEQAKIEVILKGYKKGISIDDLSDISGLSVDRIRKIIESDIMS